MVELLVLWLLYNWGIILHRRQKLIGDVALFRLKTRGPGFRVSLWIQIVGSAGVRVA
jgi:hypothetical protein